MMREAIFLSLCLFTVTARASVSRALSIDDVARESSVVARVMPLERVSAWEGGRIVTTTRLSVLREIAGHAPSEIHVRTLGGRVGDVAQIVEGEAAFTPGTASLVLLSRQENTFAVAGRAQGQFVIARNAEREIVHVVAAGMLVDKRQPTPLVARPSTTSLDGRDALDVTRELAAAWERTHAK